jgi:hypothetical protein
MIRPRGIPPTPRAISRPIEPEGMTSMSTFGASPSFMMAPSPNFVWIDFIVSSIDEPVSLWCC